MRRHDERLRFNFKRLFLNMCPVLKIRLCSVTILIQFVFLLQIILDILCSAVLSGEARDLKILH